ESLVRAYEAEKEDERAFDAERGARLGAIGPDPLLHGMSQTFDRLARKPSNQGAPILLRLGDHRVGGGKCPPREPAQSESTLVIEQMVAEQNVPETRLQPSRFAEHAPIRKGPERRPPWRDQRAGSRLDGELSRLPPRRRSG